MTSRGGTSERAVGKADGSREDLLPEFRRVRVEIRAWIGNYFGNIAQRSE